MFGNIMLDFILVRPSDSSVLCFTTCSGFVLHYVLRLSKYAGADSPIL